MNFPAPGFIPDLHFEALKAMTRLQWLLNFEAVASLPDRIGAVAPFARSQAKPN